MDSIFSLFSSHTYAWACVLHLKLSVNSYLVPFYLRCFLTDLDFNTPSSTVYEKE